MYKLLIWGTGNTAKKILSNGLQGDIIGFIQSKRKEMIFREQPIYVPEQITVDYDYIIVANIYSNEIYETCIQVGLDLDKIIFMYPCIDIKERIQISIIKRVLGIINFTLYCEKRHMWENSFFMDDLAEYERLNTRKNFVVSKQNLWPILKDKYGYAGTMNNYFWQDLWAAQHIIRDGAIEHFDIGSRLDGFIAHLLAANIHVNMIDIRPFPGEVDNLSTVVDDATMLNNIEDESLGSLSALCSLEHFGLGRYGDSIDPEACFKCFDNIPQKLRSGGKLYLSVPIGLERVEFNAHRVFYAKTIITCFSQLELLEYSCVAEGKIERFVPIHKYDCDPHNGEYRFGLFRFVKK